MTVMADALHVRIADFFGGRSPSNLEYAAALAAIRIPEKCPDCKGSGYIGGERRRGGPLCRCLNAPTIADRLDAADSAEVMLDAIDAVHVPDPNVKPILICNECDRLWPCPTHRILHPSEETA